jgi:hypothetical protein
LLAHLSGTHADSPRPVKSIVASQEDDAVALKFRNFERQRVIEEARLLPLLDGVFFVLLYEQHRRELGPRPHARSLELAEVFPLVAVVQLEEARVRAAKLLASAYAAGDSLLTAKFDNSTEVRDRLAAEHPGFSAKSYDETVHFGCFQAR